MLCGEGGALLLPDFPAPAGMTDARSQGIEENNRREGRPLPPRGGKGRPRPYCINTPKFTCVLL